MSMGDPVAKDEKWAAGRTIGCVGATIPETRSTDACKDETAIDRR
ncbi:MAG: hypothetical protein QOF33_1598 [Thermomicrobiales bacterium]|nr:hypothetical protein [Thermomicrobiales bacterium]